MSSTRSRALLRSLPVLALALAAAVSPPTEAERQHLARLEPLRVCADPHDHPLDFIDADGVHRGIAADLLAEISERLGVSTRLVPTETWDHTLELARTGECDVVSMLNATPSRAAYLNFTRPYATFENVIVANRPVYHRGLASLAGRTVALPEGYRFLELIAREHPDIRVLTVSSAAEAVEAVSRGEAYATIVNQQRLVGDLQRLRLDNLHYAGDAQVQDVYRFGIRKDDEVLLRMIDHGLSLVPAAEIDRIMNRWYVVPVEPSVDWRVVWSGGGAAGVLLMMLLLHAYHRRRFYRLLEAKNRELEHLSTTDPLTQTANRRQIDRRLAEEIERSRRHGRPCAVILIDIDGFKQVNDRLGHRAGDLVIVEVAEVARRVQRLTDVLGRWGGDEFVLICPETRTEDAAVFAERLRAAVRGHAFPHGVRLTVSAGVAELDPADTEVSLLERADAALYRAKAGGRDRVVVARHEDLAVR